MTPTAALIHAGLFVVAVIAYIVLTVTGHDGNPIFLFFAGQVSGVAVQAITNSPENTTPNASLQVAPKRSTIE